jgi:hypothetical protein
VRVGCGLVSGGCVGVGAAVAAAARLWGAEGAVAAFAVLERGGYEGGCRGGEWGVAGVR